MVRYQSLQQGSAASLRQHRDVYKRSAPTPRRQCSNSIDVIDSICSQAISNKDAQKLSAPSTSTRQSSNSMLSTASLHKQLEQLERDWDAYKRSSPPSHRSMRTLTILTVDNSPKPLVSSLQQTRSPSQVTEERREPLLDGRIRHGRNLLEDLELSKDDPSVGSSCNSPCSTVDNDDDEKIHNEGKVKILLGASSASSEEEDDDEMVSTESEAESEVCAVVDGRDKLGAGKMAAWLLLVVVLLLSVIVFASFRMPIHVVESGVDNFGVPT